MKSTIYLILALMVLLSTASAVQVGEGVEFITSDTNTSYYMANSYNFTNVTVYSTALNINGGNITTYPSPVTSWINMSMEVMNSTTIYFTNNITSTNITIDNGFANFSIIPDKSCGIYYQSNNSLYQYYIAGTSAYFSAIPVNSWYIKVDSTPPTAVTLLTPVDGDHTNVNQTTFDWTDATDDTAVDKYQLVIANNSDFAAANVVRDIESIAVSTYTLTVSEALPDGIYYWRVRANDTVGNGYGDWSVGGYFNVTIDTVNPEWILGNYPRADNTTRITTSITWDAKVTDTNLYRILLNVTNSTGDAVETNYTTDWTENWFNFSHTTDTSGWDVGVYTVELSATDDHTDTDTDLKKGKKGESVLVFNSSSTNTEISASFVKKGDKPTAIPGDFNSTISEKVNGQYKFGYNFTVIEPETKLILNITSDDKLVYRSPISGFKGHFVWENYYMDFADVPGDMDVTVTKISDYNYIVRIEGKTQWIAGQEIIIDPVTGGLNTVTEYYTVTINTPPVITTISDQTTDEAQTITMDVDATDYNLDTLIYSTNRTDFFTDWDTVTGTGTWVTNFSSAGTYYVDFGVFDGYEVDNQTVTLTVTELSISGLTSTPTSSSVYITWVNSAAVKYTLINTGVNIVNTTNQFFDVSNIAPGTAHTYTFTPYGSYSNAGEVQSHSFSTTTSTGGSTGGGSSSGGTGGGSGTSDEPSSNVDCAERGIIRNLKVDIPIYYNTVNANCLSVIKVTFTPTDTASQQPILIEGLKERSKLLPLDAPGTVYKNVNMYVGLYGYDAKTTNEKILFKVPKVWVTANSVDPSTITIYHYDNGWNVKATKLESVDTTYYVYETQTESTYGRFAISTKPITVKKELPLLQDIERFITEKVSPQVSGFFAPVDNFIDSILNIKLGEITRSDLKIPTSSPLTSSIIVGITTLIALLAITIYANKESGYIAIGIALLLIALAYIMNGTAILPISSNGAANMLVAIIMYPTIGYTISELVGRLSDVLTK